MHYVTRIDCSSESAVQVDSHRPRDMANRHLICHFLDLDLLERPETRCTSLHVQSSVGLVLDALFGGTRGERSE